MTATLAHPGPAPAESVPPGGADAADVPLNAARRAAFKVLRTLRGLGVVTRARVAGSVRRGKDWCRDLDIVVCPERERDLWGHVSSDWTQRFLDALLDGGRRADSGPMWLVKGGITAHSRQITLQSLRVPGFKVELWTTVPEHFGWMLMIRTGPAELGPALMRCARARGFAPEVQRLRRAGTRVLEDVPTPTEHAACAALGVRWRPPDTTSREAMARDMHAIADAANIPESAQ